MLSIIIIIIIITIIIIIIIIIIIQTPSSVLWSLEVKYKVKNCSDFGTASMAEWLRRRT